MQFESEIKTALKKAGLSEDLADQITVKTVDEIEGVVTKLKSDSDRVKNLTTDEFIGAVKKAGLEDALKKYTQSETDRRVTEAIKTHEAKLSKTANDAALKEKTQKDQESMTTEQKEIQALKDANEALVEKLDGISKRLETGDLDSRIRSELKKAGLSEVFISDIKVNDPEKVADAVSAFKTKFDLEVQASIDAKLKAGDLAPVKSGMLGHTLEENKIAEYAQSIGKGGLQKNPDFQGKISSAASQEKAVVK
jgi:soluble cytochrome b562